MSLYGIFIRYDWSDPTYLVGLFPTEQVAKEKLKAQRKYDEDNDTGEPEEMYYILKVPFDGKASFERDDKSHICLD